MGGDLFQLHKSEVCTRCIEPACKAEGSSTKSCMDHLNHCCGGASAACQCDAIKATCEQGNAESCSAYADTCCADAECQCEYHTLLCSLSLESLESAEEGVELSKAYLDAEDACFPTCAPVQTFQAQDLSSCQCSCKLWDPLCRGHSGFACLLSASRCCGSPNDATHSSQCYCEMGGFLNQNLNYDLNYGDLCANAKEVEFLVDSAKEKEALERIFNKLGGAEWSNEDKAWLNNATQHCDWFGVTCDSTASYIVKLNLTGNNLVGAMNSRIFASFSKLESLVLADNKLQGAIDFNSFYDLRRLKLIDMSKNNLSGEVDVLLSPTIQHLNLSHNNFSSLVHFKFRGSQTTLEQLDLSHNNISQDVSRMLENIPTSLKELILSENHIHGSFPDPLPVLVDLQRFIVKNNKMTGRIPDLSRSFPRLQELDLSHQRHANHDGLSGAIPSDWINIQDLVILDLSGNKLTNIIPPDIGNLPKLKKLFLANNELSGDIPGELGNLARSCDVLDLSNNALSRIPSKLGDFMMPPNNALVKLSGIADL